VKNRNPSDSAPFRRTIRAAGRPSPSTVASVIAFGSRTPASIADSNQRRNCSIGSALSSPSLRPCRVYSVLRSEISMGPSWPRPSLQPSADGILFGFVRALRTLSIRLFVSDSNANDPLQ
jgi:hypothetical protein